VELNNIVETNYKKVLDDIEKRMLTPSGKITIIKSYALSKLNYLIRCLPNPPDSFL
jgi:hypothetical protein